MSSSYLPNLQKRSLAIRLHRSQLGEPFELTNCSEMAGLDSRCSYSRFTGAFRQGPLLGPPTLPQPALARLFARGGLPPMAVRTAHSLTKSRRRDHMCEASHKKNDELIRKI